MKLDPQGRVYVIDPDGNPGLLPQEGIDRAVRAGYQIVEEGEAEQLQTGRRNQLFPEEAYKQGLTRGQELGGLEGFGKTALSAATFGLSQDGLADSAQLSRFAKENPGTAFAGEVAGMLPLAVAGGAAGAAVRGAAAGGSALARGAAFGADFLGNAAIGGVQEEAHRAKMEVRNFSPADAAVVGLVGEALGRGAVWSVSKALGGSRNLVRSAERKTLAEEADRGLGSGGWVEDYQNAHHAKEYQASLGDLAARDLDTLEDTFSKVTGGRKKRARIQKMVEAKPELQKEIHLQARQALSKLSKHLTGEDASRPARNLAREIEDRIARWDEQAAAPHFNAGKLWKDIDEIRQVLQEHMSDLHQAYQDNPSHAWMSREGLEALDSAAAGFRRVLLEPEYWGKRAVEAQDAYARPFHEKWFPARKTVMSKLHFSPERTARGFAKWRGDPKKVQNFLKNLDEGADPARSRELFEQYLDGAEAILHANRVEDPAGVHKALDSIRRLRKAQAISRELNSSIQRQEGRSAVVEFAGGALAGAVGGVGGLGAWALSRNAMRGMRMGEWLGRAGHKLGWFTGKAKSIDDILGRQAWQGAAGITDDFADSVFSGAIPRKPPPGASPRPGGPGMPPGPGGAPGGALNEPVYDASFVEPELLGTGERALARRPPGGGEADYPQLPGGPEGLPSGQGGPMLPEGPVDVEAVIQQVRDAGIILPDGSLMADSLEKHIDKLRGLGAEGADIRAPGIPKDYDYLTQTEDIGVTFQSANERGAAGRGAVNRTADTAAPPPRRPRPRGREPLPDDFTFDDAPPYKPMDEPMGELQYMDHPEYGKGWYAQRGEGWVAWDDKLDEAFPVEGVPTPVKAPARAKKPRTEQVRSPAPAQDPREAIRQAAFELGGNKTKERVTIQALREKTGLPAEELHEHLRQMQRSGDLVLYRDDQHVMKERRGEKLESITVGDSPRHLVYLEKGPPQGGISSAAGADPRARFEQALQEVEAKNPPGSLLTMREVRQAAGLSKAEFDRVANELSDEGLVSMHHHDMAASMPRAERDVLVQGTRGGDFVGIARRDNASHASGAALAGAAAAGGGAQEDPGALDMAWGAPALLFTKARARLVAHVAKQLFAPVAVAAARAIPKPLVYDRVKLQARQEEFERWQQNPGELIERVEEGFRDADMHGKGELFRATFNAAAFLKEKLPQSAKINPLSVRKIPLSVDAARKYAQYEEATLRPKDTLARIAATRRVPPEAIETWERLYPELMAELRMHAVEQVRQRTGAGLSMTVQAKKVYADLFGGDGMLADAAFAPYVSQMVDTAFAEADAQSRQRRPGGPQSKAGNAGSQSPEGLQRIKGAAATAR